MKKLLAPILGLSASLILFGCGGESAGGTGGAGSGTGPGATTGPSGPSGPSGPGSTGPGAGPGGSGNTGDWTALITADWELASGSEKTNDVHQTSFDHDVYIGAIRPIAPVGTHHTVLALGGVATGNIIFASGVGTNEIVFPKGVGLKIPSGETVYLQLHLFNTSASTLTGTSGIEIIEVAPADLEQEADLILPGPMDFQIPPNQTYTDSGVCTLPAAANMFAVFPHMHQLGTHLKSTLTIGGTPKVIHDGDYSFYNQAFIPMETIALGAGDTITTECTWNNTTSQAVTWGESSTTEMCFSILYRYPAQGGLGICSN